MSVSTARYVLGRVVRLTATVAFSFVALGMILWNVALGPTSAGVSLTSIIVALVAWGAVTAYVGKWLLYPSDDDDTDDERDPYDFPNLTPREGE